MHLSRAKATMSLNVDSPERQGRLRGVLRHPSERAAVEKNSSPRTSVPGVSRLNPFNFVFLVVLSPRMHMTIGTPRAKLLSRCLAPCAPSSPSSAQSRRQKKRKRGPRPAAMSCAARELSGRRRRPPDATKQVPSSSHTPPRHTQGIKTLGDRGGVDEWHTPSTGHI